MKSILSMLTKNPLLGVIAGALTTAVLQSSSATTVMAIGFVSAGLMTLPQAISIILGANIGTTMTAQIIAFKISDYIYLIVFLGFLVSFVCKTEKAKNIGQTIFAFGLLFLGIETMGGVMKPLASSPIFTNMIAQVSDIPVLGVAVGTLMTLVVQSSSATIAVLQNFASQAGPDGASIIGLAGAIPILLGDNIGTTITALLASVGQSKNAKRTAVAHSVFNISGCLLFIWIVKPYAAFIQYISPAGPEVEVISRQIANAHTIFNLTMTIIWMFLINKLMVPIVMKLVPDGKRDLADPREPKYLDEKLIGQPSAALQLVAREVLHCSGVVREIIDETVSVVKREDKLLLQKIYEKEEIVRNLNERITEYLSELFSAGVLTEEQATQTAGLMYVLNDVERIGSLCGDVARAVQAKMDKKYKYTKEAMKELEKSLTLINEMFIGAMHVLQTGNKDDIKKVLRKKGKILDLDINMRKAHMERVSKGKCAANLTAPYNKILHAIDRMGNSCVNIADAAFEKLDLQYFMPVN